jgi:hypothetical protein
VTRRRREAGRRRMPAPAAQAPDVPDWVNFDGEPMFVVDFTLAGFPIGMRQENEPHWLDEK